MLDFFRRYQRYFFIVIAVVIVVSFSFFGTYQTMQAPQEIEDRNIGAAVDGKQMRKREIDELIRFIRSDRLDIQLSEKGVMPNFFNDGFIRKDLFSTGLGVMLASEYFDRLSSDLEAKIEKHKQFRPYAHPSAPLISVDFLWSQILPKQKENLDRFLQGTMKPSPETFSLLVDLYLGETVFPPHLLREYLMYQQKQHGAIQPDPSLQNRNLNLFQCYSIEDWFGASFLELVAQFIHNTALIAEKKGYRVSKEQARVALFKNGYESLKHQMRKQSASEEELASLWKAQLTHLQMDEKTAVRVWTKIMLCRRLFEDYGNAALLDSEPYEAFHSYASKTAAVDLYRLPSSLQLADFYSMLKLEFYCQAVSLQKQKGLELPTRFASINTIKQNYPELLQKRFLVEVAEVKKEQIALDISLKETWEWQIKGENFERLQKEFPTLAALKSHDAEACFTALEGLNPKVRKKVDHFSRLQIVDQHPQWVEEALGGAHIKTVELSFDTKGRQTDLEGIENGLELFNLLNSAAAKRELDTSPTAQEARKALEMYTNDGQIYYRFSLLDRDAEMSVLTFEEANQKGILDHLLDRHLEKNYQIVRAKNPACFQTDSGDWKPFDEVKLEIGKSLYQDLLSAIDREASERGAQLTQDRFQDLNVFYPSERLYTYMRLAEEDIRAKGSQSTYLSKAVFEAEEGKLAPRPDLDLQWNLTAEAKIYKNHEKSPWFDSNLFSMVEKSWSAVKSLPSGRLYFFQLQEKKVPEETYMSEIKQGREILSTEAQRFLMTEVLETLRKNEAIHLSHAE